MPNTSFEDLLAPFVDQAQLHAYLVTYGVVDQAETITTTATTVQESIIGVTPTGKKIEERQVYMSTECLTQLAFDDIFMRFRDDVERMIRNACRQLKVRFNPYATVELNPLIGRNGRILTLELTLGEDFRHVYFRNKFPGGRYRPDDELEVRHVSGVRTVAEGGLADDGL